MFNVTRERRLLARMIASSAPLELVWQGNSCQCCRVTLKAEVATSLYGIEDRYSCSVLLLCPEVLPVRSTAVRLNGKQYVVIGLEHGPGDISLRLDLREGF